MEAKDLMIDDWYQWYSEGKYYYYRVKAEDFTKDYIRNFEPIPLTPDILELNGFYVYNRNDYSDAKLNINIDEDNLYQISLNRKGEKYHIAIHYIKWFDHKRGSYDSHCLYSNGLFSDFKPLYVHELQHALHLCGLSDIANNFKVIKS